MGRGNWNPSDDISDLSGKVILVTGGNSGLGRESILALAKQRPGKIYLAARDISKGSWALDLIKKHVPKAPVTVLECDLSSLSSVRNAARKVASESSRLDILMCNAGVVACPKGLSEDGYEIQFATNHLGHALLIKLLLPMLRKTAELHGNARIVSLTSPGFGFSPKGGIQFNSLHSEQDLGFGGPPKRYGQSKLANIIYADELSRRNPQLTCVSIDPGAAKTELFTNQGWLMKTFITITTWMRGEMMWSAEEGAYNQLWAATADIPINGALYKPIGKHFEPTGHLKDAELRQMLWDWTEGELKAYTL
ncbi:hypothetical protein HBI81_158420 [Parastagonospora nodorum]|nr:hypothetical protein HBH52_201050 [Parastagonospora nodorum]KAH4002447.1 hypothetical protein HBI10_075970 [Parastagonospora nodorum]KAH4025942.1 hypothetical protein HBI13_071780 [Parastagonospora nodorum]KAH4062518.1 hypothetical protein HBH50_204290 [Parastagonospora nodorum]KAH4081073.1 hypothetical protein HBH48_199930 [Parastagonospora nodorum]